MTATHQTEARLVQGSVGSTLIRLTLPMFLGILSMMLFNIVDTFFVGRLGPLPLAAMGFTFPVVFIITGTAMGMGIGMSSVVSRAIGEGNWPRVSRLTTDGLAMAVFIVAVFVAVGLLTMDPLFRMLGADVHTLPLIRSYMVPWYLGVGFLVIPMVGNSAIRATGDTKTPSFIMILAGTINVVLDPFLIFGWGPFPRLELQGAAIATVTAYSVTFLAAFYILRVRDRMIRFSFHHLSEVLQSWGQILHVGLPAVGTNLLVPLATGIITRIMAGYGTKAVAAFGVGSRLESLAMAGCFALSTSMAAFAGQNFGAGRCDRVEEGIRFGVKFCLSLNFVVWLLLAGAADPLARLFNDDATIVSIVKLFLWIVPLSYGAFGTMLQVTAAFNANNQPLYSALIFVTRLFVLTVPLALLGSRLAGIPGIFAAMFIGNVGTGMLACVIMARYIRAEERRLTGVAPVESRMPRI